MKKGFTLIELLVAISIVAILSIIGLTIYHDTIKNAKIAKRSEDLRAVKNALEVYYSVNKNYPIKGDTANSTCSSVSPDEIIPGFVPKYMNAIPKDPSEGGCYVYKSNGADYKFYIDPPDTDMSHADFQSQQGLTDPKRDGADSSSDCLVDGTNITAWAIWSSCDPDKCTESSCSW